MFNLTLMRSVFFGFWTRGKGNPADDEVCWWDFGNSDLGIDEYIQRTRCVIEFFFQVQDEDLAKCEWIKTCFQLEKLKIL